MAVYNLHEISHTFQYTTIKMTIFWVRKNLLNNKKSLKGYQIHCVKWPQKISVEGTFIKVDLENKMLPELRLL